MGMEDVLATSRRSFVVHVDGAEGPFVLQDLVSLRRAQVDTLAGLPAQLEEWLRPADSTDEARWREARRRLLKLTRSESRVARLAAEGLTNKQVGEALDVRLRTVESHLTATYRKLGVRSRRDLARLFEEVSP